MNYLVVEVLLRLAKLLVTFVLGAVLYLVLTGPLGNPGGAELALLSWGAAGIGLLLLESSPL